LLLVLFALSSAPAFAAQVPVRAADEEELSIQAFLQAVETAISTMDRNRWVELLSPAADRDQALEFFEAMVPQGITRVVVKERDRTALQGTLPGEGYRLVVEVFLETGPRGRIATWHLDIRRPRGEEIGRQPWRILAEDRLASIEGLHRLSLHTEKQFAARNLVLNSVDFELRVPAGDVFVAETPEGVTALAIVGDGTLLFQPAPKEERGQLRLFSGGESLETPFTAAFIRINPFEFERRVAGGMLEPVTRDPRAFRRGLGVFDEGVPKSFNLDLSDLSRDVWSLLPQPGDFVAEVRTRRFDQLTYARSSGEAEDVTLFQRARKRNIAAYASEQKLLSRGRFFNEDTLVDYDVLDYDVDAAFYPEREWMDGRTRIKLRVTSHALGVLTFKLAESLSVTSVMSDEFGRLLFLRVRNQNSVLVNLPSPVARDFPMTLTITYSGRLPRQRIQDESIQRSSQPDDVQLMPSEPKWLFSNRTYWYPQGQVTDYATARMRITVPVEYGVVASGVLEPDSPAAAPVSATDLKAGPRASFTFNAPQPVRYLSMVVSRMTRVDSATIALDIVPPPPAALDLRGAATLAQQLSQVAKQAAAIPAVGARNTVRLIVEANKRQTDRGRDAVETAADIIRLYSGLLGDVPFDVITVAMLEDDLPGGHAPGYFTMINTPPPITPFNWRNDPAAFQGFPEFFMAHEMAHQWFGQAVGWKNYHEQWLSEGFAQYFAALYARERRGEGTFRDILRQFRRWAIEDSDQGPVYLGYRLGHIKNDTRVFRALVYNKGAAVLHMLRGMVGDSHFFAGLRRFYAENRFKKAGTDDLRKAMEAESGRNLERFFERWIYDSNIPRLRFSSAVEGQELVVRFEQVGEIFDVPVTVTVTYADGKTTDHLVLVTDASVERRLPLTGAVRSIEPNQDGGAVAIIEKR
ncbi:MAG: M1 family aminopeptidase, partial [Acidobacteriota bacterium]|nr:M1 family aminopeptidase [Acidobacteriota bacterium]